VTEYISVHNVIIIRKLSLLKKEKKTFNKMSVCMNIALTNRAGSKQA